MQFTREEETTAELNMTECVLLPPSFFFSRVLKLSAGKRLLLMTE